MKSYIRIRIYKHTLLNYSCPCSCQLKKQLWTCEVPFGLNFSLGPSESSQLHLTVLLFRCAGHSRFPMQTAVAGLSMMDKAGQLELFAPALCAMVSLRWAWAGRRGTQTMSVHTCKNELRAFLGIAKRPAQFKQRMWVGEEWHET